MQSGCRFILVMPALCHHALNHVARRSWQVLLSAPPPSATSATSRPLMSDTQQSRPSRRAITASPLSANVLPCESRAICARHRKVSVWCGEQEELHAARERGKLINQREALFGWPVTEYEQIRQVRADQVHAERA